MNYPSPAPEKKSQINYYDILEVSLDASEKEIRDSYRRLVMIWHPDRNRRNKKMAERRLQIINEAYNYLKNESLRARYDQMLRRQNDRQLAYNDNSNRPSGFLVQFWLWLKKPLDRNQDH
jgi:curved DNA-binding protein CbpA